MGLPHSRAIPLHGLTPLRVTLNMSCGLYGLLLLPSRVILIDRVPPLRVTPLMVCLLYGLLLDGLPPPWVTPSTGYPP